MAAEDYFDDYGYEEDEFEVVSCNRCGATNLEWRDTGVRWRLLNSDGKFHICNTAASADDFEVVS